jgi:hypothetical protein
METDGKLALEKNGALQKKVTSEQITILTSQFLNMILVDMRSVDQIASPQINGLRIEHQRFNFRQGQAIFYPPPSPVRF